MLSHLTSWTCADFLKLNNGLGKVVIQLKKNPHKSNSFRRESISKLPGGIKAYERVFLSLVCGHHIRSGNFEILSCLNELELCGFFLN